MAQQTSYEQVEALKAKIAELNEQLKDKDTKLTAAEESARLAAASQGAPFMQTTMQEAPTGKTVKVKKAINPWVKDAKELKYEEVELPTYYYKIDLPPSGGICIKINGDDKYHGETYAFTIDELRVVKDQVHRAWAHEANINGSNENVFRRPSNMTLSGRTRH